MGGHGQGGQQQAGEFKGHTEIEGGEWEGGGENDAAQEDQNDVGDRAGRNGWSYQVGISEQVGCFYWLLGF